MAKIRVIQGGCGITYNDGNGVARHALKTAENGPFECDAAQADRLVRLGVAAYVATPNEQAVPTEGVNQETDQEADQQTGDSEDNKTTGRLAAAELESWDYNELKKLAADMGVEPKGKKKADYIAAIASVEVDLDDDAQPNLGAVDPE